MGADGVGEGPPREGWRPPRGVASECGASGGPAHHSEARPSPGFFSPDPSGSSRPAGAGEASHPLGLQKLLDGVEQGVVILDCFPSEKWKNLSKTWFKQYQVRKISKKCLYSQFLCAVDLSFQMDQKNTSLTAKVWLEKMEVQLPAHYWVENHRPL